MGQKDYNISNEESGNITELLGNLPKVSTPDNFEYKLMLKIQNEDFNLKTEPAVKKNIVLRWAPAAALAFSAVVVFFIYSDQQSDLNTGIDYLFENTAKVTETQKAPIQLKEHVASENSKSLNSEIDKKSATVASNETAAKSSYTVTLQPNDVVVKKKAAFPFDQSQSVDVDNALLDGTGQAARNSQMRLVGHGPAAEYFDFRGFALPTEQDREVLENMKARMDSIWKAKIENSKQK